MVVDAEMWVGLFKHPKTARSRAEPDALNRPGMSRDSGLTGAVQIAHPFGSVQKLAKTGANKVDGATQPGHADVADLDLLDGIKR